MGSLGQTLLARGFSALKSVHGDTWTFGAETFTAIATALRPDDPRLSGGPDMLLEMQVASADMPDNWPRTGSTLTHGGKSYTVASIHEDTIRQLAIIVVSA